MTYNYYIFSFSYPGILVENGLAKTFFLNNFYSPTDTFYNKISTKHICQ